MVPGICLLAALLAGPVQSANTLAVRGFDPVELTNGKEVKGDPNRTLSFGLFRYQFANDTNVTLFHSDPERYSAQLGGSCARMGPFSGLCNAQRFAVHKGRIYLFASGQCMSAFKKNPDGFVLAPDLAPTASAADKKAGKALLDKAVAAVDSAGKFKKAEFIDIQTKLIYATAQGPYVVNRQTVVAGPDMLYQVEGVKSRYAQALIGKSGYRSESGESWRITLTEVDYLRRSYASHPLLLLYLRNKPGFVSAAAGKSKIDGVDADLVTVWYKGVGAQLAIDSTTGHVLEITRKAITGSGMADVAMRYSDYKTVYGIQVPHSIVTLDAGKPITDPRVEVVSVTVNGTIDPRLFKLPKP